MNKKANEIEKELTETNIRLGELTEMRDGVESKLETLRKNFIIRKVSLDALQVEESKLTALDKSIQALEETRAEVTANLQKASAAETRKALLEKAKIAATEAEKLHDDYFKFRTEFNETMGKFAEKSFELLMSFRNKQREFADITRQIDSAMHGSPTMERNSAISTINNELKDIGVESKTLGLARTEYFQYTPLKFGEPMEIAVRIVDNEKYQAIREEQRQQREADQAARRAQRPPAEKGETIVQKIKLPFLQNDLVGK